MHDRFVKFTIAISKLNKLINKVKSDGMKDKFDLKGVHTLCLYQLMSNDHGMTSTEIAKSCDLDPALVSRTINELCQKELIQKVGEAGKYHARYCLTQKGAQISSELKQIIQSVQLFVDQGITEEELDTFYSVMERLSCNFEFLSDHLSLVFSPDKE